MRGATSIDNPICYTLNSGIIYDTSKVASKVPKLEEKNLLRFLETVREETNIRNIFGKEKEKALKNFENFQKILFGLSQLSKYFEKKENIEAFSVKKSKTKYEHKTPTQIPDYFGLSFKTDLSLKIKHECLRFWRYQ